MKPSLTIAVLCLAITVSAQQKPFNLTVQAGFNLSNADLYSDYILGKKESKPGFQIGVAADYALGSSFSLQSGLSLTTKGVKHRGGELWIGGSNAPTTYYTMTKNSIYLQVPLKLAFHVPVNQTTRLVINAGPYIAYGIAGNETLRETTRPSSAMADEKYVYKTFEQELRRKGDYFLKRMDYGFTGGLGFTYNRYMLSLGYEMGIPDIGKIHSDVPTSYPPRYEYKNRNLFITAGYRL